VDWSFFAQLLLNGLVMGVIYALVAMGLSLIFGVLEIVNFAHGEFYMLASMLAYFLTAQWGFDYWATILVVTVVGVAVGYVLFEGLLLALRGETFERSILLTMGLSMVLQNGAVFLFTTNPHLLESKLSYQNIVVGDFRMPVARLYALGLGFAAFAVLYLILHRTRIGKAMRGAEPRGRRHGGHRRPRGVAAGRRHRHRPDGPGGRGPRSGLCRPSADGLQLRLQGLRHHHHRRPRQHLGGRHRGRHAGRDRESGGRPAAAGPH
jgi:branched-chain amino acid transport system permease protein